MHLLLIEDQEKLAENVRRYLETETYAVTVCQTGTEGFEKAMMEGIDLIILDINLPGMDGFELCQRLREAKKTVPILMLTARTKREEIVRGLNTGADDYLVKPFDLEELLARVRALLRRGSGNATKEPLLQTGEITVDANAREVRKNGTLVELSPREYALFEFLLRNKGMAQDRPRILEHVWGGRDDLLFSQTVDVHVAYIRKKLGKDAIRTVTGKGYLVPDA